MTGADRENRRRCRSVHQGDGTVNRRSGYPIGLDPTIENPNSWDEVPVLGAVTDDGDSFCCWTEDNLETQHRIWLMEALKDRFGEEVVVFLDRAGYFYTRDLWEHISGKQAITATTWMSVFPAEVTGTESPGRVLGSADRVIQAPARPRFADTESTDPKRIPNG